MEYEEKVLHQWYRDWLKEGIAVLLKKWQPIIGKILQYCGVKKMKTK
jgi:hypothetical protein